jgi:3-hydroxyacyl-[acyl-carrier-protein] dehydratase
MRFLFVDHILQVEPKRLLATKTITAMDGYLSSNYYRLPALPATLMLECMAQTGGWLNIVSREFHVKTVMGLIAGVRIHRQAVLGETVFLEAHMLYAHADGATMRARAWVGDETVASVDQFVFLHLWDYDEGFASGQRQRFANLTLPAHSNGHSR